MTPRLAVEKGVADTVGQIARNAVKLRQTWLKIA
jgi:hypothetical protein